MGEELGGWYKAVVLMTVLEVAKGLCGGGGIIRTMTRFLCSGQK